MPQVRGYPHWPYDFYTNSSSAEQSSEYSSSSIPFQDSSYYLGRMQDSSSTFGSGSHFATLSAFDTPYMFASDQEALSSSLEPTAGESWNLSVPELEAEPTSPSESGSQHSTSGGSSVELQYIELSACPDPLNLGKLTACQHCRRRYALM